MIRQVEPKDIEGILAIYGPIILNTSISFEYDVPSKTDFSVRVFEKCKNYPFLVYVEDNNVLGYAYASFHRERAAYQWSVETSVYVANEARKIGIGAKLYKALFKILEYCGYYNAYAGIVIPNNTSERFHANLGFNQIGIYYGVGHKFNKWLDVGWWTYKLNDRQKNNIIAKPISVLDLSKETYFDLIISSGNLL